MTVTYWPSLNLICDNTPHGLMEVDFTQHMIHGSGGHWEDIPPGSALAFTAAVAVVALIVAIVIWVRDRGGRGGSKDP